MIGRFTPWVETTGSGKLRLCCRYDDVLTGAVKRTSVALSKTTKKAIAEAEQKLREKIEKTNSPEERKKLTFSELVELYKTDMQTNPDITPSTCARNGYACKALVSIIGGNVLVSQIQNVDVLGALTRTGESAKTKNNRLKRFRALIHWAYQHGYIDNIQFLERMKDFKTTPHKMEIADKYLERHEYLNMCEAIKKEHHLFLFKFLVLTGCRTGEALALEKSDVDIENKVIRIDKTYDSSHKVLSHAKSVCSIREIHIQPELMELLRQIETYNKRQELRTGIKSGHLFHDDRGERRSYFSFRKHIQKISYKVVGRDITPHTLRHTSASLMFEAGFSVEQVQRRLGHENSEVTKQVYIHITDTLKERENRLLDGFRIG